MKFVTWTITALLLASLVFFSACYSSSSVKIGVIIPQEGASLFEYGYQITSGIQVANDEIKAFRDSGKPIKISEDKEITLKKNLELIIRTEDQNDLESVKATFQELTDLGVKAVIGPASSASMLALTEMANSNRVILFSPAASSPEINSAEKSNDYIFRNQPSDTLEAQTLSNVIFQKCRIQKVLMVRARNTYAEGVTLDLLRFGRQNSSQIPGEVVKFASDVENVDFVPIVDKIIEIAPEAVFLGGYYDQLVPLLKEIRSRSELDKLYIFTSSAFLPDKVISSIGADAVEGIMFTAYHWDPSENKTQVQDFVNKFRESYHVTPDIYAANGYDALWTLALALEESDHWIRGETRSQLGKHPYPSVLGGEIDFNKRGDVTRIPKVYRMTNGLKVLLTKEELDKIKEDILTRI